MKIRIEKPVPVKVPLYDEPTEIIPAGTPLPSPSSPPPIFDYRKKQDEPFDMEFDPGDGQIVLSKVYEPIGIETANDGVFYVAQRDSGLEIKCPDGTLIGVKCLNAHLYLDRGRTFLERDGKIVSS